MLYISDMFGKRNKTSSLDIDHALYLYFPVGLSTRSVSKAIFHINKVKRSHVAIWKWIQKYKPQKISIKNKSISEFIVEMKPLSKLVQNQYGFGLQLSHKTGKFSHKI